MLPLPGCRHSGSQLRPRTKEVDRGGGGPRSGGTLERPVRRRHPGLSLRGSGRRRADGSAARGGPGRARPRRGRPPSTSPVSRPRSTRCPAAGSARSRSGTSSAPAPRTAAGRSAPAAPPGWAAGWSAAATVGAGLLALWVLLFTTVSGGDVWLGRPLAPAGHDQPARQNAVDPASPAAGSVRPSPSSPPPTPARGRDPDAQLRQGLRVRRHSRPAARAATAPTTR